MKNKALWKKRRKKYKLIEIKTNTRGWHDVELIKVNKGGTITIRLSNGHIIDRKIKHVRWGRTKRIKNLLKSGNKKSLKHLKTRKKRRKSRKPRKNPTSSKMSLPIRERGLKQTK